MSFAEYLKETRNELRHVAWPTQTQTIVYTIFVVGISVGVALYLGLFDFLFTSSLQRVIESQGGAVPTAGDHAPVSANPTPQITIPTFSTSTNK
jgi:preprotein translocase SecE subunit